MAVDDVVRNASRQAITQLTDIVYALVERELDSGTDDPVYDLAGHEVLRYGGLPFQFGCVSEEAQGSFVTVDVALPKDLDDSPISDELFANEKIPDSEKINDFDRFIRYMTVFLKQAGYSLSTSTAKFGKGKKRYLAQIKVMPKEDAQEFESIVDAFVYDAQLALNHLVQAYNHAASEFGKPQVRPGEPVFPAQPES